MKIWQNMGRTLPRLCVLWGQSQMITAHTPCLALSSLYCVATSLNLIPDFSFSMASMIFPCFSHRMCLTYKGKVCSRELWRSKDSFPHRTAVVPGPPSQGKKRVSSGRLQSWKSAQLGNDYKPISCTKTSSAPRLRCKTGAWLWEDPVFYHVPQW